MRTAWLAAAGVGVIATSIFFAGCGGSEGVTGGGGSGGGSSSSSKSSTSASTSSSSTTTSGSSTSSSSTGGGICGDGNVDVGEACDDGNTANGDGCGATCVVEHGYDCTGSPSTCTATCGDGVVATPAEACDDGNMDSGDGCSSTCAVENGFSCMGEPSACMTGCGDGIVAGTEACDDNNMMDGDGCSSACAIETGYSCSGMPSVCALTGSCATPIVVPGSGFMWQAPNLDPYGDDLANTDATCKQPESGGTNPDVVFQVALQAGDTLHVTDSGAADVLFHVLTGACDSATPCAASFDGGQSAEVNPGLVYKSTTAQSVYVVIDSWTSMPPATDNVDLLFEIAHCGDGMVGSGEACDDGGTTPGDGCSATCTVEPGYSCTGQPSVCSLLQGSTCNDPIVASDGFAYTGSHIENYGDDLDFTDASCLNVSGTPNASPDMVFQIDLLAGQRLNVANFGTLDVVFQVIPTTCAASACLASFDGSPGGSEQTGLTFQAPSTGKYYVVVESYYPPTSSSFHPTDTFDIRFNVATCGDGVVEFGEPCDDHNVLPNDGCSATCTVEPGFTCTGSPSVCTGIPAANCANPILVTGNSFQYAGSDIKAYGDDATYNGATCASTSSSPPHGYDIVFLRNMVAGETIKVRELGGLDSLIHILTPGQCNGAPACVVSSDNAEATGVTYTAAAAGPVYIVVESWGAATSSADFDVRIDSSICGDGVVSGSETCDDGGVVPGDGCSATCATETGFVCDGAPSTCADISACTDATCALGGCTGTVVTGVAAGVPVAIPDNQSSGGAILTIPIAATGTITKMAMRFNATHTWDSDISSFLKGPTGGELDITSGNGSSGDNYTNTIFRSGVSTSITSGSAPFTGIFAPETSLAGFNGQSVTGTWTLRTADTSSLDTGSVTGWDIAFCVTP